MTRRPAGRHATITASAALALASALGGPSGGAPLAGQVPGPVTEGPTGLEVRGLPGINFDADEGFGYGVLLEAYQYGMEGRAPYEWTLQPTVFLTTGGRRDFTAFFDAPHLLPGGWRLDGYLGWEEQIATPFYGIGNRTTYDPSLDADEGPNPYYYRFGRTRRSALFNLQRPVPDVPVRFLFGGGLVSTRSLPVPEEDGTTLWAATVSDDEEMRWTNYVRGGLIWDTRDRETGPTRGTWTEALIQWVDQGLGADVSFVRWTVTDRRYVPLPGGVVLAHRVLLQGVTHGAPVEEMSFVQTSFKQQEGLGGSKTVRGLVKNRYTGRGMFVWNAEMRWRALELAVMGQQMHAVLSAYVDHGRVWAGDIEPGSLLDGLHRGYGGGLRLGMGENFVAALDLGTSSATGLQMYIGLGYLY